MALKKASTGWAWVTWEETSTFLARPIFEPPRHCDADRAWGTSSTGRDIIPGPYSARRRGRLLRGDVVDTAAMAESRVAKVLRRAASRYADHLAGALGDRLVAVVLFGSVARGDAGAGSDVDLLIVARDLPEGQFARKGLLAAADLAFEADVAAAEAEGVEVRLARLVRTPEEAARVIPLYLDMTEDAVLLLDRGGFFAGVLDRLRASLRRYGAKRVRLGSTWYWDLKPDFVPGDVVEL